MPYQTPSLCNRTNRIPISPSGLSDGLASRTSSEHIDHALHAPRYLTRFDCNAHSAHQCIDQAVDFLTSPQLVGVQVEDDESDVSGQAGDAVIRDVFDEPAQDRLERDFIAVGERGAERGAVTKGGDEGEGLSACVVVL